LRSISPKAPPTRSGGFLSDEAGEHPLAETLCPFPTALMDAYPVDRRVGNVRSNGLLDEIAVAA
jgi:hypothetical protein